MRKREKGTESEGERGKGEGVEGMGEKEEGHRE